jgi:pimeloyl-ACP methyl ester carboxylesterase
LVAKGAGSQTGGPGQNPADRIPLLVITSEASYHTSYDDCTVAYLRQAGVHVDQTHLPDVGIHGNGHMMMLEKNNLAIAAVMTKWLDTQNLTAEPASKRSKAR